MYNWGCKIIKNPSLYLQLVCVILQCTRGLNIRERVPHILLCNSDNLCNNSIILIYLGSTHIFRNIKGEFSKIYQTSNYYTRIILYTRYTNILYTLILERSNCTMISRNKDVYVVIILFGWSKMKKKTKGWIHYLLIFSPIRTTKRHGERGSTRMRILNLRSRVCHTAIQPRCQPRIIWQHHHHHHYHRTGRTTVI